MARTDFESKMRKMGENIDDLIAKVKDESKEEAGELKAKWESLKNRADEMGDKTEEAWEGTKDDFESDMKNIEDEYEIVRVKSTD